MCEPVFLCGEIESVGPLVLPLRMRREIEAEFPELSLDIHLVGCGTCEPCLALPNPIRNAILRQRIEGFVAPPTLAVATLRY
jgi:hypothetical protein